jgi:cytochrome b561
MKLDQGPRYSAVAMTLHWLIAIAVIVNWRIAGSAEHLSRAERGDLMAWHFTVGFTVLLLTVLRIAWRIIHRPPPLAPTIKPWERTLARVTHSVFYILLIALPLGAWIGLSASGGTIDFWGLFTVPALPVGVGKGTGHEILELHATIAMGMIYLIGLHILGALKHTFFDKDGNLFRMLPFGRAKA